MDDRTFINHFLDTNFEVKLVEGQPVIFDLYESNTNGISEIKFHSCANKIFGIFISDDGILSNHLVKKWLKDAYSKLLVGYKAYLFECKVILTINGWLAVNSVGEEVNSQTLIDLYNCDIQEIESYFDDWWYAQIGEASRYIFNPY